MDWARILAYVTGTVDQELLARNEYLAAENRILKAQLNGRLKLSDAERGVLGEIGHRLGRKVLADVATSVAIFSLMSGSTMMLTTSRRSSVIISFGVPAGTMNANEPSPSTSG